MDLDSSATPGVSATTTHNRNATNAEEEEEEEEIPLLFMDTLPSNFQQNAQLAAIATFMADSDDEEASEAENGNKQRRNRHQTSRRTRRRQQPYAKPLQKDKEPKTGKNRDETKSTDTKELQLFLSMFHVN